MLLFEHHIFNQSVSSQHARHMLHLSRQVHFRLGKNKYRAEIDELERKLETKEQREREGGGEEGVVWKVEICVRL